MHAVRAALDTCGPVTLVIEDLHWVDEATRELLLLLARDLPSQLSLLLTYRRQDLPGDSPVLGAAYRRPPGTSGADIHLDPLTETGIHTLTAAVLGSCATHGLSRTLFERSAGLPLVVEEDLITLSERGPMVTYRRSDGAARAEGGGYRTGAERVRGGRKRQSKPRRC
ncbi:hypothetical protein [Streptomyces bicolor]|uniref:hypothetical protein n=1 Tax=Streptomyces bicolor TaxID=66874 RepID=UPI000691C582|nr:hypothetical protein [Streptomyces bicolor]